MTEHLKEFFERENIEYYSAIAYSDCRVTAPHIMGREVFEPQSVVVYLLPYFTLVPSNISRYAASLDYHIAIKAVGEGICAAISRDFPSARMKIYGDHSPIDERGAALACGLGILGDNGLIINEKYGSYVFVGDVVTDVPPELLGAISPMDIKKCSGCGACRRACPTGALRGECLDCLSEITQRKGVLSDSEIALMRKYNTAWGCDVCQEVCPYNSDPAVTPLEFFHRSPISRLSAEIVNSMDRDEFSSRAFAWRKKETILRNLGILEENDN